MLMFFAEYKIIQNDEAILVFRKERIQVYAFLIIGIISFVFCLMVPTNSIEYWYFVFIGSIFLILGTLPLFYCQKIIIDKTKNQISFRGGVKKILLNSKPISFSNIRQIEIKESILTSDQRWLHAGCPMDTIYLNLKKGNNVKLGISTSEIYSNEFTFKLSETIGCKVIFVK